MTELGDAQEAQRRDVATPTGLNNLLYTADADFSCFADLALASPEDYRKQGEGSLLQCVLTPGDPWIPKSVDEIVATPTVRCASCSPRPAISSSPGATL